MRKPRLDKSNFSGPEGNNVTKKLQLALARHYRRTRPSDKRRRSHSGRGPGSVSSPIGRSAICPAGGEFFWIE
jgi:hypothetical protein